MSGAAVALAAAALLLAVSIHLTMPHYALMVVRVLASEITPWLIALALVAAALALVGPSSNAGRAALAAAAVTVLLAGLPLARLPGAIADAERELRAAAGDGLPEGPPPFSPATTALGLRAPDVAVTRDLPFTVRGATLRLDRYDPPGSGALRPAVVVVHGGSWRGGDKGQSLTSTTEWSRTLAGHGFVVYDIQYRLVPDVRHPVPFEDVRCALAHVRASSAADGVDPERVVLLGRSAGAHLALLAAYRDDAPCGSAARIRGVVALYGPTDLLAAYAFPGDPDLIGGRDLLRGFIGGTPDDAGDRFRDAMPRTWLAGAVPTLLIHGSADQLVYPRHSEDLAQRLRERGAPVALVRLPWSGHSFDAVSVGVGGQLALSATVRFARAVTRPG